MCTLHGSPAPRRPSRRHLPRGVTRRDLLRFTLAGMGVAALGPLRRGGIRLAHGAPLPLKRLVVVNLIGGNDGLNTVVPVTLAPYFSRRPTLALDPVACLSLAGGPGTGAYRLHPVLTNLQALWNEGALALVNRVGYPTANLSHFTSQDIYSYGVRDAFGPLGLAPSGWVARYADAHAPTPMGAAAVGVGRPLDFEGGATTPFIADSLATFRFDPDPRYPDNHLHRIETVKSILGQFQGTGLTQEARDALDQAHALADQVQAALTAYSSGTVTYPTTAPGSFLRDVAVLIEGGFETRVFYTGFNGFDTHGAQGTATGTQATLLQQLDQGLGAFVQDLKNRGLWDDVVICVISEFGRRNYQNGSDGTDHGHANAFLVLGGAVAGGMYGPNLTEADLNLEYPTYAVDFRDLYKEILTDHLGGDASLVFPEPQPTNTVLGIL